MGLQGLLDVAGNVTLCPARGDCVAPHAVRCDQHTAWHAGGAPRLDFLDDGQQLHGLDASDGTRPQEGQQVFAQVALFAHIVGVAPVGFVQRQPVSSHGVQGVAAAHRRLQLFDLAGLHGVDAFTLLGLGHVPRPAGVCQSHGGVTAQGHAALFAIGVRLPEPSL